MRKILGPMLEIQEDKCLSWNVDIPPCQRSCPLGIDVEGYVGAISRGDFDRALDIIKRDCPLPAICAHICYAPCEVSCKRGKVDEAIAILDLKRAAVDFADKNARKQKLEKLSKEKVAVIGSGPSGLSCAYYLTQQGYPVTIFEASPLAGGMLRTGIPEYRLPKDVLDREIEEIKRLGVEIRTETPINKDFTIDNLFHQGYKAVFIATGAHERRKLDIPGENTAGVIYGLDFLKDFNSGEKIDIGKKVAVIGGGNVAIDVARYVRRLGSEASVLYRRSKEEMPAHDAEIKAAEAEGVKINCLVSPIEIQTINKKVTGVRCIRMELGAIDQSRRRQSIPISGSEFHVDADTVISAIGEIPDLSFIDKQDGIETTENGTIKVDPASFATTKAGIFAGGDVQAGPFTAISAMADGKKAAVSIQRYLKEEKIIETAAAMRGETMAEVLPRNVITRKREEIHMLPAIVSIQSFKEVNLGYTPQQAIREARRCLKCKTCNRCLEDFDCVAIMPCQNNGKLSPRIDQDLCIACQVCAQRCPYGSIHQKEMKSE